MNTGYLNTLPCDVGKHLIGHIYQDVYSARYDEEGNPVSSDSSPRRDDFLVYCTKTPNYHNGQIISYNRSYSYPNAKDIFLLPDSWVLWPWDYFAVEWGEAYFIPVDSDDPVGGVADRFLAIERGAEPEEE